MARRLGLTTIVHERNRGYGGNQKTCYAEALRRGADIVIMVHPDYQYTPKLIPAMARVHRAAASTTSRWARASSADAACRGGCRCTSTSPTGSSRSTENLLIGEKLSEYHTGYRAFSRQAADAAAQRERRRLRLRQPDAGAGGRTSGSGSAEVTCPTLYFEDASSINFRRSVKYGFGVLGTAVQFRLAKLGLHVPGFLRENGRRLDDPRSAKPVPGPGTPRRRRDDFAADTVLGIAR